MYETMDDNILTVIIPIGLSAVTFLENSLIFIWLIHGIFKEHKNGSVLSLGAENF